MGSPKRWQLFFEMLIDRVPADAQKLVASKEYIVRKDNPRINATHWKSSAHGRIVYSAGTLGVHIKNTYHNAHRVSKRESRKEPITSHLMKEGQMGCPMVRARLSEVWMCVGLLPFTLSVYYYMEVLISRKKGKGGPVPW